MRRSIPLLVLTTILGARSTGAQASAAWIGATLGVEQPANKNPGASPYIYRGYGLSGGLRFVRWSKRDEWDAELTGSRATLRSIISEGRTPRELLFGGAVGGGYVRRVGAGERVRWRVGAAASMRAEYVHHEYAGQFGGSDDFGVLMIGMGPAARTELRVWRGTLTNRIVTPLASWVDYPYSNARAHGDRLRLSFASLNRVQAVEDELSYRRGRAGGRGVNWRYRFSFFRYTAGEPRVLARQSLALEMAFPLWSARQ